MEKRELELQAKLIKYENKYQFLNYAPIGKLEEFLDQMGSGKYFIGLVSAANGIGKTTLLVNFLANLFWGKGRNVYFRQPLFLNFPYLKRVRIISDPETLKGTIVPAIEAVFPRDKYTAKKQGDEYLSYFSTDTGWILDVMSYEQSVKRFESANLGLAIFDEPPPEPIFKATVARMREGGLIFILATPLIGSAWLFDNIIDNPNNESKYQYWLTAEVEDACEEHGVRGFLKHDNILKMIAQYNKEDLQARVFGKPQHLTGLVFKEFDDKIHVIDPFDVQPELYTTFMAYDYHTRTNDAVLYVAVDRQGRKYVVDEIWAPTNTKQLVYMMKQKESMYNVQKRLMDPSGFVVDKHTGRSFNDILSNKGLVFYPGSKRRSEATKRIQDALHFQKNGGLVVTPPELFIFRNCTQLIYELKHWQWNEYTGVTAEKRDKSEKPQDKNDHLIENLGRILLEEPRYSPLHGADMRAYRAPAVSDSY